ncbi:hypothetical protein KFK09_000186 [Dendrobium nobile]|uniref:NAC domain-containing protein n=1 Tax=Dendrobium nobile TaxID=94219 RepID=A0A8T3CD75_DENNO|nr:hypothetical protein KFK09_000186 [Dendrobium nobile]
MNNASCKVPPGFRFHPTDEELVNYYLRKKVSSKIIDQDVIKDVELCKIEPWDLQDICGKGKEDEHEWYFFSHRDKKYLTGSRTNRATKTGFWKATGRDKPIYLKQKLVGMKKTLVFYKGRAPNGQKSDWILHEYRLERDECEALQEDGWVVCRVFKKRLAVTIKEETELEEPSFWYNETLTLLPSLKSQYPLDHRHHLQCSYKEQILQNFLPYMSPYHHLHLPPLELQVNEDHSIVQTKDWRVLEKLVASQLSQDGLSKCPNCCINSQDHGTLHEQLAQQVPYYYI